MSAFLSPVVMSATDIPWPNKAAKLVALVLADFASEEHGGVAWPSNRTIAQRALIGSPDNVGRSVADLEALGLVHRIERPGLPNTYAFDLEYVTSRTLPQYLKRALATPLTGEGTPPQR